jgi:hypothetical protein
MKLILVTLYFTIYFIQNRFKINDQSYLKCQLHNNRSNKQNPLKPNQNPQRTPSLPPLLLSAHHQTRPRANRAAAQPPSSKRAECRAPGRTCCTRCPAGRRCRGSPGTAASARTTAPSTSPTPSSARTSAPSPSGSAPSSPRPPPWEGSPWPPCTTPSTTRSSSASRSPGPTPGSPAACSAPASSILPLG